MCRGNYGILEVDLCLTFGVREIVAADRALIICRVTVLGAGCGLFRNERERMGHGLNHSGLYVDCLSAVIVRISISACIAQIIAYVAGSCAGCTACNHINHVVAGSGNDGVGCGYFSCAIRIGKIFAADRAFIISRIARLGAGGCLGFNSCKCVGNCCNDGIGGGYFGCACPVGEKFAACRAYIISRVALCRAGGLLGRNGCQAVRERGNCDIGGGNFRSCGCV